MEIFPLGELCEMIRNLSDFEHQGIMSRKVDLEYEATSKQPWLYFTHPSDERLSFRVHELEFGATDAIYWNTRAQKEGVIEFSGFAHKFFNWGIGTLRGYLKSSEPFYRTGLIVKDGRMQRVVSQEQLNEAGSFMMYTMLTITEMQRRNREAEKVLG